MTVTFIQLPRHRDRYKRLVAPQLLAFAGSDLQSDRELAEEALTAAAALRRRTLVGATIGINRDGACVHYVWAGSAGLVRRSGGAPWPA